MCNISYIRKKFIYIVFVNGSGSSIGRAKLWRCLGYKFKSYLGQDYYNGCAEIGRQVPLRMEWLLNCASSSLVTYILQYKKRFI